LVNEIPAAHSGKLPIKRYQQAIIQTQLAEVFKFLLGGLDQQNWLVIEHSIGVGKEGQNSRPTALLSSFSQDGFENSLMTQVKAVEHPDGQNRIPGDIL
jgi:hypothetical protein